MNDDGSPRPNAASTATRVREEHCACGALLARWVSVGLELKCRRCKRVVTVLFPTEPTNGEPASQLLTL